MRSELYKISQSNLDILLTQYPNIGKNSDVGKFAVEVTKLYFKEKYDTVDFLTNKKGVDLTVIHGNKSDHYEVKGTASNDISWNTLKISSQNCYNKLVEGMEIIRVTNIGNLNMEIFFLKYGEDFDLIPEPRWSVKKVLPKNGSFN